MKKYNVKFDETNSVLQKIFDYFSHSINQIETEWCTLCSSGLYSATAIDEKVGEKYDISGRTVRAVRTNDWNRLSFHFSIGQKSVDEIRPKDENYQNRLAE